MDNRGSPRPEQKSGNRNGSVQIIRRSPRNPLVHRRPHKLVCPPKPPPLLEKRQRQRQKQRLRNTIQSPRGFQQNPSPIPAILGRGNIPDTREGSQPCRPCLRSGVFFASVYIVSGNLLSIIVLHWLINISGSILFYYSNSNEPFAITKVFLFISIILSAWGLYIIKDYRGIW